MSDSLRPHEPQHTRPPWPSPTPGVHLKPCPSSWWCHPAISSSVVPFSSCPQSFPASGSFQVGPGLHLNVAPGRPLVFHVPWCGFLVPLKLCADYSFLTQANDTVILCLCPFFSFLFHIGVQLINDVVFVWDVQQSHLVRHIHVGLNTQTQFSKEISTYIHNPF